MRLCVYCASSARAPAEFGDAAYRLGKLLAAANVEIVFGGGGVGSMGRLADGALEHNGRIVGVMPDFMRALEWAHPRVKDFTWTTNLADRKAKLLEDTDGVIALPGGSGTFEELLEVITHKRLGIYLEPIVIVNQNGFYTPLIQLFQRSVDNCFMDKRHLEMFSVVETVDDVLPALSAAPTWRSDARSFATQR